MRPKRVPFVLFKHKNKDGPSTWFARFWDADSRCYAVTRSTGVLAEGKRERKAEAQAVARAMLPSIHFTPTVADRLFVDYVEEFWTPSSPYVIERALVLKRPLSAGYVKMNHDDVGRHIRPYTPFKKLALKDLKPGHIRDWMSWAAAGGMGTRRINMALQAMRVAVRYAIEREELDRDPFLKVKPAHDEPKEKGVLTPAEVGKLIAVEVDDPRARLCVFLGALCGFRRGEVRGLQWGDVDLDGGVIHVRHNYIDLDGVKAPKAGSARTVPIPSVVHDAFKAVYAIAPYKDADDFVVFHVSKRNVPVGETFIQNRFEAMLEAIGIKEKERKERNLTFHGLRHSFVTIGRLSGLPDLVIQALAGHKSAAMMERYSHAAQVIDFNEARAKIEKAVNVKAVNQ